MIRYDLYCAKCHDSAINGGVTQILDVYNLIGTGLIVPGNPAAGRLIASIESGAMPKGGTLVSAAEVQTLKSWISSMKIVGPLPAPGPGATTINLPPGKTVRADSVLHTQAMAILNTNCAGCHQGTTSGGISTILDIKSLVIMGLVVPGDASKGTLMASIESSTMPKGGGARVSAQDQLKLKNWIASMTIVDDNPNLLPMPTRPPLSATFTGVFTNIIQPKCIACHGPIVSHDLNLNGYSVVRGRLNDILDKCSSGEMPVSPYPKLTNAELNILNAWVQSGAPQN